METVHVALEYTDTNPFQAPASVEKIVSKHNFGSWSKTTWALDTHTH